MHTRTILALLALAGPARADVIILKDGFTLHGTLKRELTTIIDPYSGTPVTFTKAGGLNMVDDGVRHVVYPASSRQVGDVDDTDIRAQHIQFTRPLAYKGTDRLPTASRTTSVTDLDPQTWSRVIVAVDRRYKDTIRQHLTELTPYSARLESSTHRWTSNFRTDELGPKVIKGLLDAHPDLRGPDGKVTAEGRFRVFNFYRQAGWYEQAFAELEAIGEEFPGEKERAEQAGRELRAEGAARVVEAAEKAREVGQHDAALAIIGRIPEQDVPAEVMLRVTALRGRYATEKEQAEAVRVYLQDLPQGIDDPEQQFLVTAAAEILEGLRLDNVGSLEPFFALADQAAKNRREGQPAQYAAPELLALAASGWAMGPAAAEADVGVARRLWAAREFAGKLLRSENLFERRDLIAAYESRADKLGYDELAEVIRHLPPPEPIDPAGGEAVRRTRPVPGHKDGVEYALRLPPEYHHGRAYPVLIALDDGAGEPGRIAGWLADHAARNGYILAAPHWMDRVGRTIYRYSEEQHNAVTATLRDLRQHLQVDSDRVFLTGFGDGGTMAFDVGCSHPHLFAGVVPMNGSPNWSRLMTHYAKNAQYLPFYTVTGTLLNETVADRMRPLYEVWSEYGFPSLLVLYKGRGADWFGAEWPDIFDWMNRKRRANPLPELGRSADSIGEREFRSLRQSDDRFYWLQAGEIGGGHLIRNNSSDPARLYAAIKPGNRLEVRSYGTRGVTVWLGPGMIDFDRPVFATSNGRPAWEGGRQVKPDLALMLEDLVERGDRQRLYLARVDLPR